jgi:hypothetical protein
MSVWEAMWSFDNFTARMMVPESLLCHTVVANKDYDWEKPMTSRSCRVFLLAADLILTAFSRSE